MKEFRKSIEPIQRNLLKKKTIIKVRRGINGFKYSACDEHGYFIGNFAKLADVRKHWHNEIKWGQVVLIRELDQMPDITQIEAAKVNIENILKTYAKKKINRRKEN